MLSTWFNDPFVSGFSSDPFSDFFEFPNIGGGRLTRGTPTTGGGGGQLTQRQNDDSGLLNFNRLLNAPISIDMEDRGDHYEMNVRRPAGLRDKDLKLEIQDNTLTIHGERKREKHRGGTDQISYTSFSRSVVLPEHVNANEINAECGRDGTLHISLPKIPERQARQIPIGGQQKQQQQLKESGGGAGQYEKGQMQQGSGQQEYGGQQANQQTQQSGAGMYEKAEQKGEPSSRREVPIEGTK